MIFKILLFLVPTTWAAVQVDLTKQTSEVEFFAVGKPSLLKINGTGGKLIGKSVALRNLDAHLNDGFGLMLERSATIQLLMPSIAGFRCAVNFVDGLSSAELRLPGNDLTKDNLNRACGSGQLKVIE